MNLMALILTLLFLPAHARTPQSTPVIVILKSRALPQYTAAQEQFAKSLASGGITPSYITINLKGNPTEGRRAVQRIAELKPALVLAIGTLAAETAVKNLPRTPIVFSMVLNPVDTGLVPSMESSGANVAGASLDIPVHQQFETLKAIMPGIGRIGVLYNPSETVSVIADATRAARSMGIKLLAVPVTREADLPRALQEIKTYQVDCMWSVSDSTVFGSFKSIQFVINFAQKNRIPFVGLSASFVKFGALLAMTADPALNGQQAAEIALRVLGGEQPSTIPVATPGTACLYVNHRVARLIGVTIPSEVLTAAREVYQ